MELVKKVQSLKKEFPAFIHRLVEHCRRLCAVIICISMVLSGFPSVFLQALAAGDSDSYVYELDSVLICDALDKAVAEGTTLDSKIKFLGEHQAEYDELFMPDGTLYELKDLKTDHDIARDKNTDLSVFVRIEGDINLDEAYEADGSEEVIFLVTNRAETERHIQIALDDRRTEMIDIPAAKDIPAGIYKDDIDMVPVTGGGGSGMVAAEEIAAEEGSAAVTEEASADKDIEINSDDADIEINTYDEDTETDTAGKDAEADPENENDPDGEYEQGISGPDDSDVSDDADVKEETDVNRPDVEEEADSGETSDTGTSEDADSESADADEGTDKENIVDHSGDRESSGNEDSSNEKDTGNESDDKETDTKKGSSVETASFSLNKTVLLTASVSEDPYTEADHYLADPYAGMDYYSGDPYTNEEADNFDEPASPSDASPSDASWYINGTVYDAVRLGNRGAAAYVTTMEELGIDRNSPVSTTLTYEGGDYRIAVSYGRDAGLPRGVELIAGEYEKDSDIYQSRLAEAAQLNDWDEDLQSIADHIRLFDISLYKDDIEIEPESEVQVEIIFKDIDRTRETGAGNETDTETENEIEAETGYTIIHFGDTAVECINPSSESEDDIRHITFSVSELSDVMMIENDDYGISMLAVSEDNFNFITSNVSGEGTVNGNTFHYISQGIDPVENSSRLKMNMSNAVVSGNLLSTEDYYRDGTTHIIALLMNVSSLAGGSSSGKIGDTKFDKNVQGKGSTLKDIGTITFTNAGTIHGRSVNVVVSIDSVRLYNSFAEELGKNGYTGSGQGYVGLKSNKISIGYLTSSVLWLGENYCTDASAADARYTSSYYTYPCSMDESVSIEVQYADTGKVVDDASFLHVAEDIDIYYRGAPDSQSAGRHGIFAETFKTLDGFSGDYYIYATDRDYIYSASRGVVTAQATQDTEDYEGESGTTGDNQYKVAGIYADTDGGSWEVAYSEGWCSTIVEIYDYTTNDITVKKADKAQQDKTLNGAGFYLYYEVNEEEGGKETLNRYYYSGYDATYHTATWVKALKEGTEFTVPAEALVLTTQDDGTAKAYCISPGDYFLEEVTAPDGYNLLTHVIDFSITTYGVVISSDPDVVLDEGGSLTITILNTPGVILPDTGGPGTEPFRIAGLFVSGSALCLLYIILNRKRGCIKRW